MPRMTDTGHGPLPEVLARLAHDSDARPFRPVATGSTRIVGAALCLLIFAVVILAGTGHLA